MDGVKAYIIANLQIHDADRYREYEKGFFPILKKYEGEFITFDDNIVHLEGDKPMKGRIVLLSFPSTQHAEDWYTSEDYQALSEHRRASVTTTITKVNGMPPRD